MCIRDRLCVVARKIFNLAFALENQQMVYHLIHEIAVVAHHDYAAWEILQIFFQHLQSLNVKVVGWLIEHKEVWILHQHRTQIQLSSFATAELIHIVLLLLRCEHEILQKLCLSLIHISFEGKFTDEVILHWLKIFCRRFFAQQFKRSCLPDGPKVGSCSLSPRGDWRMPSDAANALWLQDLE